MRRVVAMSTLEADIEAALTADDEMRLRAIASSADWSTVEATLANRILQRIAMYGCSGRTQRYRDIVEEVLAAGNRGCRHDARH